MSPSHIAARVEPSDAVVVQNDDESVRYSEDSDIQQDLSSISDSENNNSSSTPNTLMSFANLSMWVTDDLDKKQQKCILDSVCGEFRGGELVALMGPSGAGKSTLMTILSGQGTGWTGEFTINGQPWSKEFKKMIGYAQQNDLFFPEQSVYETLRFNARMRLPRSVSTDEIDQRINEILVALHLDHRKDTRIGGFAKTLSGGELKRLSIALELQTRPKILILDEPTSGLDSTTAYEMISIIKNLARTQKLLVLVSIHQPSMKLFSLFDRAAFMRQGRFVFHGPAGDTVTTYVEKLGHPCAAGIGISDHMLDLLVDEKLDDSMKAFYDEHLRYTKEDMFHLDFECTEPAIWPTTFPSPVQISPVRRRSLKADMDNILIEVEKMSDPRNKVSYAVATWNLFLRTLRAEARRCYHVADLFELAVQVLIQAVVFWQVYENDQPIDFYSHLGQLIGVSISITFKGLFTTMFGEITLRQPVRREIMSDIYDPWTYSAVRLLSQFLVCGLPWPTAIFASIVVTNGVPKTNGYFLFGWFAFVMSYMLGQSMGNVLNALTPSFSIATDYAIAIQLISLLVSGSYTTVDTIPPAFKWLQYISLIFYPIAIGALGFIGKSGMMYDCSGPIDPTCVVDGMQLVRDYGINMDLWQCCLSALAIFGVLQITSAIAFSWSPYYRAKKQ